MEPYSEFARKKRPSLVRFIMARYSFDNSRAQDVVQDALIQGFKHDMESGFVHEQHRWGYVRQCARSRAIDEIRRGKRQAQSASDVWGDDLLDTLPAEVEEAHAFIASCDDERLQSALEELAPQWYEVLLLAFFEGLTNAEIASQLKLTMHAVEGRKHRAVERLRRILGGEDK